jgi:haloalkane dehalogenase
MSSLLSALQHVTKTSEPRWLDRNEYPFASHHFQTEHGRMHYLDEGQGDVIVMVHGTPEWSFVYRKLIKGLAKDYRCIAPDFLGFGLSDKPANYSYKPEEQAKMLERFITSLNLKNITLVVHDFGGPFGLSYASNHPDNVRKLVIMNTWLWSVKDDPFYAGFSQLMKTPLGKLLYLQFAFSPRVMMKQAVGDKAKFTKPIHQHYLKVFPTPESRRSTLAYAKSLVDSDFFWSSLWERREVIQDIPALILWGMKDIAFKEKDLQRLEAVFKKAQTVRLDDVGHFVQEEAGEDIIPLIIPFRRSSDLGHLTARAERVEIEAFRLGSLDQRIGIRGC